MAKHQRITEKYDIGDRVEFIEDGETVRGEVVGVQAWQQARYSVLTEDGVNVWPERGLRPAGKTDRDGDNVPSGEERVREYAEAIAKAMHVQVRYLNLELARACVAVEERHTAELRAEVERLRATIRRATADTLSIAADAIRNQGQPDTDAADATLRRMSRHAKAVRDYLDAALRGPAMPASSE